MAKELPEILFREFLTSDSMTTGLRNKNSIFDK